MKRHKAAMTIVCIDRDETTLELLEWQFRKAGFIGEMVMFTEFSKALAYLETNKLPDILISDFFLNKFDHFESLLKIQKLADLSHQTMKLIITCEFSSDKERLPAAVFHVNFAVKPVDVDLIAEWIKD